MGACRKRFVFVNLDACMASQGVTLTVLEQLKASFSLPLCKSSLWAHAALQSLDMRVPGDASATVHRLNKF